MSTMKLRKWLILTATLTIASATAYVGAANLPPRDVERNPGSTVAAPAPGSARFVTYNIVRGTRMPIPPMMVRQSRVDANLAGIGHLLQEQAPVVVALQEAEARAGQDHVAGIAHYGAFGHWADDTTVGNQPARHGAALLASAPLTDVHSEMLPRGSSWRKGWIAATVQVPELGGGVRVVAVHLDPFSATVRERQVDELVKTLENERRPLVVMGDFNCDWEQGRCVQRLAENLSLEAAPTQGEPTYRFWGARRNLDWVLVSQRLRVTSTQVVEDAHSDHCMVVADIARAEDVTK